MADLLSDAQHARIRKALNDVFDTFSDTRVKYFKKGELISDFMEDFEDTEETVVFLNGIVEYMQGGSDKAKIMKEGAIDNAQVKVTFALDELDLVGLIENNIPVFQVEEDYMEINGERFEIIFSASDGPLEEKNVAVVVYGKREETNE